MKIRKGDTVMVISWKDTHEKVLVDVKNNDGSVSKIQKKVKVNKTWKVLKVLTKTSKIVVEWINIVSRHYKKVWTQAGQIIKKENPIEVSNVMLVCPFTSKPTRVWFVVINDKSGEKKFRFSKIAVKVKGWEAKDYIIK